jgi:hypothetical protein
MASERKRKTAGEGEVGGAWAYPLWRGSYTPWEAVASISRVHSERLIWWPRFGHRAAIDPRLKTMKRYAGPGWCWAAPAGLRLGTFFSYFFLFHFFIFSVFLFTFELILVFAGFELGTACTVILESSKLNIVYREHL